MKPSTHERLRVVGTKKKERGKEQKKEVTSKGLAEAGAGRGTMMKEEKGVSFIAYSSSGRYSFLPPKTGPMVPFPSLTLCLSRSLCCGMSAFSKRAKRIRFSRVEVSNPEHTPHPPLTPFLKVERFFFRRDLFLSCNLSGTKKGS